MTDEKQVLDGFFSGICCAMQVFGSAAPELGLDEGTAKKIASCFSSGMEHAGTCGCVTGAYMALGLKYGNSAPGEVERMKLVKEKREEFDLRFKEKFGSIECIELLRGVDPSKPEGLKAAVEGGLFQSVCAPAVCAACEITKELLSE